MRTVIIVIAFMLVAAVSVWRVADTENPASGTELEAAPISAEEHPSTLVIPYYYFDHAYDAARCDGLDCVLLEDVPRKYHKDKEHTIIVRGEIGYKDKTRQYANEKRALAFSCLFPNASGMLPACEVQELLFMTTQSKDSSDKTTLVNWPTIDPLGGRPRPLEVVSVSPSVLVARQHTVGDRSGIEYRLDRTNEIFKIIDFWYEGEGEEAVYHYVQESERTLAR